MIELFSEAMGNEIKAYDIKEVDSLLDNFFSSVVSSSIHLAMRAHLPALKIHKAIPNWSTLPIFNGVFLSYEMPETVIEVMRGIPMVEDYPTKAKIQIAENSFTHGGSARNYEHG